MVLLAKTVLWFNRVVIYIKDLAATFMGVGRESEAHPAFKNLVKQTSCRSALVLLFREARSFSRSPCRNAIENS